MGSKRLIPVINITCTCRSIDEVSSVQLYLLSITQHSGVLLFLMHTGTLNYVPVSKRDYLWFLNVMNIYSSGILFNIIT